MLTMKEKQLKKMVVYKLGVTKFVFVMNLYLNLRLMILINLKLLRILVKSILIMIKNATMVLMISML